MSTSLLDGLYLRDADPKATGRRDQEIAHGHYIRINPTLVSQAGLGIPVDCTPQAHQIFTTTDEALIRLAHTIRANGSYLTGPWTPLLKLPDHDTLLLVDITPAHITLTTPDDQLRCDHCLEHLADPHDPTCPNA